jgi:hypothetical protein
VTFTEGRWQGEIGSREKRRTRPEEGRPQEDGSEGSHKGGKEGYANQEGGGEENGPGSRTGGDGSCRTIG